MARETANRQSAKPMLTPEEQELARKRDEQNALETELAECELRSANMRAELRAFEQRYLHVVGLRYVELDELKAQLAERAASENATSAVLRKAAQQARTRADETKSIAGDDTPKEPEAFVSTPEMKRLYREVAKRIHPDLTSDEADRAKRQQLMMAANEAYERGDEKQLTRILTRYEFSPEAVKGEGAAPELIRVIRGISQARSRIEQIESEIQELSRSDLYQLKTRLVEAEKIGRDVLKEMVEKVETQIAEAKKRLQERVPV